MATGQSGSRQQRTHLIGELKWNERSSLWQCRKAHRFRVRNAVESRPLLLLWRRRWLVNQPCRLVPLLAPHVCHHSRLSAVAVSVALQVATQCKFFGLRPSANSSKNENQQSSKMRGQMQKKCETLRCTPRVHRRTETTTAHALIVTLHPNYDRHSSAKRDQRKKYASSRCHHGLKGRCARWRAHLKTARAPSTS